MSNIEKAMTEREETFQKYSADSKAERDAMGEQILELSSALTASKEAQLESEEVSFLNVSLSSINLL